MLRVTLTTTSTKASKSPPKANRWVPKDLITSNNINAIATWIPKGTKIFGANIHGSKIIWYKNLKHNLLSISQLCDKGFNVLFDLNGCKIINIETNKIVLIGHHIGNIYTVHLDDIHISNACFVASDENDSWL
ncbi:hypothetical protein GQ457_12G013760 [Hibiscus cannabinus]